MGKTKGKTRQKQGSAQQYHGPVAPRSHGTRMAVGGRSLAEGVRVDEFRVGDDWAGDWRPRAADEGFVISTRLTGVERRRALSAPSAVLLTP